jgi:hypothetical protein
VGIDDWPVISVKTHDDIVHLCHEQFHVEQFYQEPLAFWINYLIDRHRAGDWNSRYEKPAFAVQARVESFLND